MDWSIELGMVDRSTVLRTVTVDGCIQRNAVMLAAQHSYTVHNQDVVILEGKLSGYYY